MNNSLVEQGKAQKFSAKNIRVTCSDYWSSYAEVFDPDTHQSVGKHTGLTNHVEGFNATARHGLGRLTRQTLSFSKNKENHEAVLHAFILQYNQEMMQKYQTR
ncbi:IS1 family transposase [Agitococcus lubricus]|uniref:IS1 family transposase n=1 Tax=Agitococcus lubricus TaxID=1077255 RepID=UPI001472D2CF|nr:IS1 family transposase [Agitococcus lubricus]